MSNPDGANGQVRNLTFGDIIFRTPLPQLVAAFGGLVAVVIGAYSFGVFSSGVFSALKSTPPVGDWGSDPEPGENKIYYGYYGDLQKDGSTRFLDEKLEVAFAAKSPQVRARAMGEIPQDGHLIQRSWRFEGFRRGYHIVLSFVTVTDKENPNPSGIGIYELEQASGADYTGTAMFWDCESRSMVQCPYALTPTKIAIDAAKSRWPKLFERKCVKLELAPDRSTVLTDLGRLQPSSECSAKAGP